MENHNETTKNYLLSRTTIKVSWVSFFSPWFFIHFVIFPDFPNIMDNA